jgi:hypothetical protein
VMALCETGFVEKIPSQRTRSKYPWAQWEKTIMDNGGRGAVQLTFADKEQAAYARNAMGASNNRDRFRVSMRGKFVYVMLRKEFGQ